MHVEVYECIRVWGIIEVQCNFYFYNIYSIRRGKKFYMKGYNLSPRCIMQANWKCSEYVPDGKKFSICERGFWSFVLSWNKNRTSILYIQRIWIVIGIFCIWENCEKPARIYTFQVGYYIYWFFMHAKHYKRKKKKFLCNVGILTVIIELC